MGVTYDSGALIAADRGERRMWARHRALLLRGMVPTVPAPVLAQSWRGPDEVEQPGLSKHFQPRHSRAGGGNVGGTRNRGGLSRSSASSGSFAAASRLVSGGRFHFRSMSLRMDVWS